METTKGGISKIKEQSCQNRSSGNFNFGDGDNNKIRQETQNGNNTAFFADSLAVPKLTGLGQEVLSLVKQHFTSNEINDTVKERITPALGNPRVYLNINIHVNNASTQPLANGIEQNHSGLISRNQENVPINNGLKLQFTPQATQNSVVNPVPKKVQLPQAIPKPSKASNTKYNHINDNLNKNAHFINQNHRIKKKKSCNCTKKRSLENLIKHERLFNKQAEKTKYFWRGTNLNHPFIFKKKIVKYYSETQEAMVTETIDFSKKTIQADDF